MDPSPQRGRRPLPPSGEQWTITRGEQSATVVEVGGGLRTYRVGDVEVLAGYGEHEMCSSGRGQVLMPWPNRIRDGRYEFQGAAHQLPLSEPGLGNASHGLVRWVTWRLLERDAASVAVGYRLHPQTGWPGLLDLAVRYSLSDEGLVVAMHAENLGDGPAPFGCGAHPYVAIGDTPRAEVVLMIPAAERVVVDAERKLPTGTQSTNEFRGGRALGDTTLDTAFGALDRDASGHWHVRVDGLRDRPAVTVWGDGAFRWAQMFTDKADDTGVDGVRGIAVEPLSCPPDAFNSGRDIVVLEPGERWSGEWGITPAVPRREPA